MQAKDFTKNEDFIVLAGDNLWSVNDLKAINKHKNCVAGIEVKNPKKYGVLITDKDNLVEIKEKPKNKSSKHSII